MKKILSIVLTVGCLATSLQAQEVGIKNIEDEQIRNAHQANINSLSVKDTNDLRDIANWSQRIDILEDALKSAKKEKGEYKIYLSKKQAQYLAGGATIGAIGSFTSLIILKKRLQKFKALSAFAITAAVGIDAAVQEGLNDTGMLFKFDEKEIDELRNEIINAKRELKLVSKRYGEVQAEIIEEVQHANRQRTLSSPSTEASDEIQKLINEATLEDAKNKEELYKSRYKPKHSQHWLK